MPVRKKFPTIWHSMVNEILSSLAIPYKEWYKFTVQLEDGSTQKFQLEFALFDSNGNLIGAIDFNGYYLYNEYTVIKKQRAANMGFRSQELLKMKIEYFKGKLPYLILSRTRPNKTEMEVKIRRWLFQSKIGIILKD